MRRLFTEHPASVGETYAQHMRSAFGFAATMFVASLACFVHGLLPWTFRTTGSRAIAELHDRMIRHRPRGAAQADATRPAAATGD